MLMANYQTIRELYYSAKFTGESRRGTWRAQFSLRQKRTAKYDGERWCKFHVSILGSLHSVEVNVTMAFLILNILPFIQQIRIGRAGR